MDSSNLDGCLWIGKSSIRKDGKFHRTLQSDNHKSHSRTSVLATSAFDASEVLQAFQLGQPASKGLAEIAEDGHTGTLVGEIQKSGVAQDVIVGKGMIAPGASQTYELKGNPNSVFSFASMVVATNDGFLGTQSVLLPNKRVSFYLPAYDAGSEANTESCQHVPAPPCSAHDVRAPEGAEGYVHVHAGIQGIGDLAKEKFDWRNPVALVTIEKL